MSEDVVDFLRDYAAGDRDMREEYLVRRFNEAADEIERLRKALAIEQATVRQLQKEIEFASPHEGKPYG